MEKHDATVVALHGELAQLNDAGWKTYEVGFFFIHVSFNFVCLDTPLSLSIHCLVPGSPLVACILHVHLIHLFSSRNSLC